MFLLHEIKVVLPEGPPSIDRVPCHISEQTGLSVTGGEEIFFRERPFFEVIAGRNLEHGRRGFFSHSGHADQRGVNLGKVNEKVVPRPFSDSAHIRPPWLSIIFFAIANPSPVPG